MLLMVRRGIRGGIFQSIYWYAKLITNKWKIMIKKKKKELSYLQYWDVNNLYG